MQPPVEIRDRSEYKRRMNELLEIDPRTTVVVTLPAGRVVHCRHVLEIDPRTTVVVTVDMQNDYLDMNTGTAPVAPEEARRVIGHSRRLLDFARARGMPVIHAYVSRRPIEAERGLGISAFVDASQRARLSQNAQAGARKAPDRIESTPQAQVPAELVAPGDTHVTTKRVMDAFVGTDLDTLLGRVFKARTVIVTGINTDTCVYATTFAASNRGYQPVVISDCVASMRGLDHHWMALELMSRSIAWVMTVDEFKTKVQTAAVPEPALIR